MTTFNTVEELFQILDSDPQLLEAIRARILTPELLRLPESQASLVEEVRSLGAGVDQLTVRLDTLGARMDDLTVRLDTLTARVDDLTVRLDTLTARVDDLTVRLDALTARVDDLTVRLDTLTARVDALTEKVDDLTAQVSAFVASTNQRFDGIQTQLDMLRGDSLEAKLSTAMPPLLSREFNVRRPYVIHSARGGAAGYRFGEFFDTIADAVDKQVLTDDEETRLLVTDMIIRSQSKSDRSTRWFAIEASGVINEDDINRARESADAINKAFDQYATPVVYGYHIYDIERDHARSKRVNVFLSSE